VLWREGLGNSYCILWHGGMTTVVRGASVNFDGTMDASR
jgi:hypothetical protein